MRNFQKVSLHITFASARDGYARPSAPSSSPPPSTKMHVQVQRHLHPRELENVPSEFRGQQLGSRWRLESRFRTSGDPGSPASWRTPPSRLAQPCPCHVRPPHVLSVSREADPLLLMCKSVRARLKGGGRKAVRAVLKTAAPEVENESEGE